MRPPKELFWVDFNQNGSERRRGSHRYWNSKKGGKYSSLSAANAQAAELREDYPGAIVRVLRTGPLEWHEEERPPTRHELVAAEVAKMPRFDPSKFDPDEPIEWDGVLQQ